MNSRTKTALIVGSGSEAAMELATTFIRDGSEVILCGAPEWKLDAAMKRLPSLHTFTSDITSENERALLLELVLEYFPGLNVLVNDSPLPSRMDLTAAGAADAVATELAVDLQVPILLTLKFLPHLLKQSDAVIVNLAGVVGDGGSTDYPAYRAALAGLTSFSGSLRRRLEGTSVRVLDAMYPFPGVPAGFHSAVKTSPEEIARGIIEGISSGATEIEFGRFHLMEAISRLVNGRTSG